MHHTLGVVCKGVCMCNMESDGFESNIYINSSINGDRDANECQSCGGNENECDYCIHYIVRWSTTLLCLIILLV